MAERHQFTAREFPNLKGLTGLSEEQIAQHLELYKGYVKNTNAITQEVAGLVDQKKTESHDFAELTRRLGFEHNGILLHEYYFEAMAAGGKPMGQKLEQAVTRSFGSKDNFLAEIKGMAKMRGIGWVITFQDPASGSLFNRWVGEHQNGNIAGYKPVVVMDVWEHAFAVDYKPTGKGKYIDAWLGLVDWSVCESRLK